MLLSFHSKKLVELETLWVRKSVAAILANWETKREREREREQKRLLSKNYEK